MRLTKGSANGQLALEALVYLIFTAIFLTYGFFAIANLKPIEFSSWRLASSIGDTLVMNPDFGWVEKDHLLVGEKIGTKKQNLEFGYSLDGAVSRKADAEACVWRIAAKMGKPIWVQICF